MKLAQVKPTKQPNKFVYMIMKQDTDLNSWIELQFESKRMDKKCKFKF